MNKETITINGVEYVPVDTPMEDCCANCDIFKARPPQHMTQYPLCCYEENIEINQSCCFQAAKGIKRIWKIKSV